MAGLDKVDPAILCLWQGTALCLGGAVSHLIKTHISSKMQACELNEATPVAGEYSLHLRTPAVGKLRELTS
jgi:hypothetical protein